MHIHICTIDLSSYGWRRDNEQLHIVWDSIENLQQVQKTVDYLTQGCKCKTGCESKRCICKKVSLHCGPSCQCVNCKNTLQYVAQNEETEHELRNEIFEDMILDHDGDCDSEEELNELSDGGATTDEEDRLDALNRDVDELMEAILGIPF